MKNEEERSSDADREGNKVKNYEEQEDGKPNHSEPLKRAPWIRLTVFRGYMRRINERFSLIKSNVTVEPILACYFLPSVLSMLATQNLNLEKACRVNLRYESHVCDALVLREIANYTYEEAEVQKLVTAVASWKSVLQTILPCMLILFLGAWSDRTGKRKICIMLPIVGELFATIGLIVNTYYFHELPVEVAALTEALFPGLTGGWFTMNMGIFSYIADITSEESRTFRVGLVNLCSTLGVPLGMALSGILLRELGYYGVFSISASLYVFGITYGYLTIKESGRRAFIKGAQQTKEPSQSWHQFLRSFFDIAHIKDTIQVAFRVGPRNRRLRVCMLIVVVCVVVGPLHGEMTVMYLFSRFRFKWNEVDFSIFATYSTIINMFGTLLSISLFSRWLKLDDAIIGIISSTSKILASLVYAFASTNMEMYIGPLVDMFNGTAFIAMRSMVSKLVASDELGKVNSLYSLAEAMMPLIYCPLYTRTYIATLEVLPGAFFLLGAFLTMPAIVIFGWMYLVNKREMRLDKQIEAEFEAGMKSQQEEANSILQNNFPNRLVDLHNIQII